MSGAGLPRETSSVDRAVAKHSRRPAASSTTAISDGGDELASLDELTPDRVAALAG